MVQVPEFEHMLYEDGLILIKFWFSITKEEQLDRFNARLETPLKRWKFSPVDKRDRSYGISIHILKNKCLVKRIQATVLGLQ